MINLDRIHWAVILCNIIQWGYNTENYDKSFPHTNPLPLYSNPNNITYKREKHGAWSLAMWFPHLMTHPTVHHSMIISMCHFYPILYPMVMSLHYIESMLSILKSDPYNIELYFTKGWIPWAKYNSILQKIWFQNGQHWHYCLVLDFLDKVQCSAVQYGK